MTTLIIFIIASIGLTNIIVREYVFEWLRKLINKWFPHSILNKLINCETCMGFWVGLVLALLFPAIGIHWFLAGLISSAANKLILLTLYRF